MDSLNNNKKAILCALIIAVALSSLYILHKVKENFDVSYFKDPSNKQEIKDNTSVDTNDIESVNKKEGISNKKRDRNVIIATVTIFGCLLFFGVLYLIYGRNTDSEELPAETDDNDNNDE